MRIALFIAAAWPFITGSAYGWGCEGHQTIALISRAHLTAIASAEVDRLLLANPIDPALRRFCMDRPKDAMADASTWADDERTIEKNTEKWHYIDIPLAISTGSVPEKDAMRWCGAQPDGSPGCIVTAIESQWAILRDRGRPDAARAKALRYVIHFAGDIAQPLHAVDNRDRGGNCISIRLFSEEKAQNLHGIWDYGLIERELAANHDTQSEYAKEVDRAVTVKGSAIDVLAWAWESHGLAETVAYGDLKPQLPVAPATAGEADADACNFERGQSAAEHISIGDDYASKAVPVIHEQLAKAGYRLAAMLNETFR